MKTIKRVSLSPLNENVEGVIIDSLQGTNQTKNAPSQNAVNNAISSVNNNINAVNNNLNNQIAQLDLDKANLNHDHDDRYYLKSDVNDMLNDKFDKSNIAVLTGSITAQAESNGTSNITLPSGFDVGNCVVISKMITVENTNDEWGTHQNLNVHLGSTFGKYVSYYNNNASAVTLQYKVVLMKVS